MKYKRSLKGVPGHVAVLGANLGRLLRLIALADTARQVIGQNVWIAFGLVRRAGGHESWVL